MKFLKSASWLLVPIAISAAILILMKTVFFLGYVPSASMEPAIPAESWILGLRNYGELEHGDIVIFERGEKMLVKRIAAAPGDTVFIDDRTHKVRINEQLEGATRILTVPDGSYFLLGDNENESIDARYWAEPFVTCDQILARLF